MKREYKIRTAFAAVALFFFFAFVSSSNVQAEGSGQTTYSGGEQLDSIVQQYLSPDLCMSDEYGPGGSMSGACTQKELKEMTDDLDQYLKANGITSESKEYDRVKAISTYVADRVYYDDYRLKSDSDEVVKQMAIAPYQVWKQKRSICQGYAYLLHTLLIANGIPDQAVITMEHMINITYLKDEKRWIYVDTTWMSPNRVTADIATGEEKWEKGGSPTMGWFDINTTTMSNEENHLIYQIKNLVCDGVVYTFLANENGTNMLKIEGQVINSPEKWNSKKGWNLSVSGAYPEKIEDVNVHAVNEIPVKRVIYKAFYKNGNIKTVTLPDTITSIGESSFYECTSLTSINIPKLITKIPDYAFVGCGSLETVDIQGANITSIGCYGFGRCAKLKSLDLSNCKLKKIDQYAFVGDTALEEVKLTGADIEEIVMFAFSGCSGLKTLDLSDKHIKAIGNYAFKGCTSLTEVDLSSATLEKLILTFYECSGLTKVRFPDTLKDLDGYTFYKCTSLTELDLSNTALNAIGQEACSEMTALTKVVVPKTLQTIDSKAFYLCNKLETMDLSECNLNKIGTYAFYWCSSLKEIDLAQSSLTALEAYSFTNCRAATKFAAPASLETIGEAALQGCSSLKEVELSHTALTKIEDMGFYLTTALKKVSLPKSLKSIGDYAFAVNKSKILRVISDFTKTQLKLLGEDNTWANCSLTCEKGFYTLIYDGNGATSGQMTSKEKTIGYEFTLDPNQYKKTGYRFKCWNTSADGSGTSYEDKEKVPSLADKDKEEVTLYAIWEEDQSSGDAKPGDNDPGKGDPGKDDSGKDDPGKDNPGQDTSGTYEISYYLNGGTNSSSNPKSYTTKDADITLSDPAKSGYRFKGWFLEATHVTQVTKIETSSAKNIKLYAAWECMHAKTTVKNKRAATYTSEGYTGDTYCSICGAVVTKGTTIPKLKKESTQNTSRKETTKQNTSKKEDATKNTKTQTSDTGKNAVKTGDVLTVNGVKYKVTKSGDKGEVALYGFVNKKAATVTMKSSIKVGNITYKVTAIADKAFYNMTSLKKVTISSNVTKIGRSAFEKCKKLKTIIIKTQKLKAKTVGAKAFKGTPKNAKVKVPAKSLAAYQKFLVKKGIYKKAKIIK